MLHAPRSSAAYDPQSSGQPRAEMPAQRIRVTARRGAVGRRAARMPKSRRARGQAACSIGPVYWEIDPRARHAVRSIRAVTALCTVALAHSTALKLTAIQWQLTGGLGAYTGIQRIHHARQHRWGVRDSTAWKQPRWKAEGVMTNAPPISPYRGPGAPRRPYHRTRDGRAANDLVSTPGNCAGPDLATEGVVPARTALGLGVDTADPVLAYRVS